MIRESTQNNDLFRMERSVISKENVDALIKITGNHIAESILYDICFEHQYNVFGFGVLDPEKFGNKYGFSRQYLQKENDKPYQLTVVSPDREKNDKRRRELTDKPLFTNNIENALFTLSYLPLSVMNTILEKNEKKLVRKFQPLRVLKSFYLEQDRETGKTIYAYELDEDFRRNLSTYYLTSSTKSLINLRKSGLGPLYQHLLRLRDAIYAMGLTSTTASDTPNFAYLCDLARVNKNLEPKYMKRKLIQFFNKIVKETELDFTVEWVKGEGESERYVPIFHFNPNMGDVIGKESLAAQVIRREEKLDVAVIELKINLVKDCPYRSYEQMKDPKTSFFAWLKTRNEEHRKNIENLIYNTFINTGAVTTPNNLRQRAEFLIDCAANRDPEDFDRWIQLTLNNPQEKFEFWEHYKKDDA